ncbi:hypothetical protein P0136_02160 [Lentisphaerota bacterium ZTH]|nr:hypothetical protein JYG24_06700 [Lentisphaerota bacterium]WET06810.1 hypothetical protein P0136_02160 [Lentisphaerota bacterium ZTH]
MEYRLSGVSRNYYFFSLLEFVITACIIVVAIVLLIPYFFGKKGKSGFEEWKSVNLKYSRDPACVLNMNFQEGKGEARNYARPKGTKDFDGKHIKGFLRGDCEWTAGRWPDKKKAVLIPGWYSFIEIPHNRAFKFKTYDDYTISLWLCLDFPESSGPVLSKGCIAETEPGYFSELYLGNVGKWEDDQVAAKFDVICSGRKSSFIENTVMCYRKVFKKHEWVNVVLRNSIMKKLKYIDLFINGEKMTVESEQEFADTIAIAAPLLIGAVTPQRNDSLEVRKPSPGKKRFGFRGRIDELMIFRRALKDKEIKELYEAGCPK